MLGLAAPCSRFTTCRRLTPETSALYEVALIIASLVTGFNGYLLSFSQSRGG